jgi:hypothetical protein
MARHYCWARYQVEQAAASATSQTGNRCRGITLLVRRNNVEAAMEMSALRNLDSLGSHNASKRCFAPKIDTVAGVNIAEHPTKYDDFASCEVSPDNSRDTLIGPPT